MTHDINIYILIVSTVTLAIKILPLTLIRGEIKKVARCDRSSVGSGIGRGSIGGMVTASSLAKEDEKF